MDIYLGKFLYSYMDMLNRWYSDSRLQEAVGTSPLKEDEKRKHFEYKFRNPKKYSKGIFLTENDELIGYVSIKNLDVKNKVGELEIVIAPDYWGHGYGYQAAQLILKEARKLGLEKLTSSCSKINSRSLAFHKKLGFEKIKETDTMIFFELENF